jgi:transposase
MLTTLFSLLAHLLVEDALIEKQVLTLVITSTLAEMTCPESRQPTKRIHSRYTRTLADLPCQGRAVRLLVQVRRFFCDVPACSRKTFAEAFPGVAPKHARRTSRQAESLCSIIAYALGGRAGARLVMRLSMPTSRYTLLRLVRRATALHLPVNHVCTGGPQVAPANTWAELCYPALSQSSRVNAKKVSLLVKSRT